MHRGVVFVLGMVVGAAVAWGVLHRTESSSEFADGIATTAQSPAESSHAGSTDSSPEPSPQEVTDSNRAMADLYDALAEATQARVALEQELAATRDELTQTRGGNNRAGAGADGDAEPTKRRKKKNSGLDAQDLLEFGIPSSDVTWLQERYERFEMDRLQLHNTASREKWFRSGRFAQEERALRTEFRHDVGDEVYDFLLYNAGQTNRAIVENIMQESPAASAGILPGDVIVGYDDIRVFTPGEIRYQTTQGEAGRTVAVDVLRNGQPVRVYLPRGPLGVYLEPASQKP